MKNTDSGWRSLIFTKGWQMLPPIIFWDLSAISCSVCCQTRQSAAPFIPSRPPWGMREQGINYQVRLLRALKAGDGALAHSIMRDHMIDAERFMLERAVLIKT